MLRLAPHTVKWFGLLVVALTIFIGTPQSKAQSILGNISIEKGARVWIEGSAGMVNYQCRAEELSGAGEIENTKTPESTVKGHGDVHISVSLPVKSLNCGKRGMNKDMYGALKSDLYPTIRYQLLDAVLAEENDTTTSWMSIRTRGIMEIAGVADTTTIFVQGKVLSERRFQVKGSKPVHMDTYQIKPPSAMFGLIRADKELSVHFDVTVQLDEPVR